MPNGNDSARGRAVDQAWRTIDNGDYVRIGPVPQRNLPGEGPLGLAPYNNYDLHLGLRQTLYDFGQTNATMHLAEMSR